MGSPTTLCDYIVTNPPKIYDDLKGGLNKYFAQHLFPFLAGISKLELCMRILKYVLPYHVYKVFVNHPEFIIDKVNQIILLLFNIQNTYLIASNNDKIKEINKKLSKIIDAYLDDCIVKKNLLAVVSVPSGSTGSTGSTGVSGVSGTYVGSTSSLYKPPRGGVTFLNLSYKNAEEYNKNLRDMINSLTKLLGAIGEESFLGKTNEHFMELHLAIEKLKTKEATYKRELNLKVETSKYITPPSSWFLKDVEQIGTKEPIKAKGYDELTSFIKDNYEKVASQYNLSISDNLKKLDLAVEILSTVTSIINPQMVLYITNFLGGSDKSKLDPVQTNIRVDTETIMNTRKFLFEAVSITSVENTDKSLKSVLVNKLFEKYKTADIEERARICNNVNMHGKSFGFKDFDIIKFNTTELCPIKHQNVFDKKKNNSKKQQPRGVSLFGKTR
jgi:hypothetical protein